MESGSSFVVVVVAPVAVVVVVAPVADAGRNDPDDGFVIVEVFVVVVEVFVVEATVVEATLG